ncbi:MAG: hypothetical protein WA733_07730 [Methylocystis sp.]
MIKFIKSLAVALAVAAIVALPAIGPASAKGGLSMSARDVDLRFFCMES